MYSSYSPGESSSVAVVPSPHSASLSPFYSIRSPPSAFDSGFGCDLLPPKKRICSEQVTKTTNVFSFASDCTTRDQFTSQFSTSISPIFSETPAYNFSSSAATPADYQFGSIDDVLHQDSKVGLASFLHQDVVAMQTPQQQAQMRSLVAGQVPLNLSTAGTRKEDYSMIIYQEPEEYYRARYETEGIRGPLKGRENNHPAVKILGPMTYAGTVKVMLVHDDGTKHGSCFLDETKDRQKALTKKIDPQSNMIAEFEDLRIRRETKQKNYNKESGRKADKTKNTRNDKTACLRFTATLQLAPDREIELTVMSKPIQLCAPPEGAELEWLIPEYGHANGDEKIVIKGTKMTCPKVTFTIALPDGHVELPGHVDKEQSHQNVLVVKTPRLPEEMRNYQGFYKAEVRVSSGRAGTCSSPLPFYYIPNGLCHTCKQTLPPTPPAMATQQASPFMSPYFPCNIQPAIGGITFAATAACNTTPSPHQGGPLPSFHEIPQPQISYTSRPLCQEQISSVTLSHPPSNVSTPPPLNSNTSSAVSAHKDSFQQLFDNSAATISGISHSPPTLSPTSSPGTVSSESNCWLTPTLTVGMSQAQQDISIMLPGEFQPVSTNATSMQLVTSPGSETVYSAVASPDTTTPIYPPYPYTIDDTNTTYRQFTS